MKPLDQLALELLPMDEADLRRIRDMSHAEFTILLAMHKAEEVEAVNVTDEHLADFLEHHLVPHFRQRGAK